MTPDDKRRLAEIDELLWSDPHILGSGSVKLVRRLLDEAIAERDAAMAALREIADMEGHALFAAHAPVVVNRVLAANSAATKPPQEVSG